MMETTDNQLRCAKMAVGQGACADAVGMDVMSEPGQMYLYHAQMDLVEEPKQCPDLPCDMKGTFDLACDSLGCSTCDVWGKCSI
jgi:hypothetical protein